MFYVSLQSTSSESKCDLLIQNKYKVTSLYKELNAGEHVTKHGKTKKNSTEQVKKLYLRHIVLNLYCEEFESVVISRVTRNFRFIL